MLARSRLVAVNGRAAPLSTRLIRHYTPSPALGFPTAIARAEREADLKKHPEAALTQQKLEDRKGNRHWTEENATLSEADIRADHEAAEKKAEKGEKEGDSKK